MKANLIECGSTLIKYDTIVYRAMSMSSPIKDIYWKRMCSAKGKNSSTEHFTKIEAT